jgi:hypothetical protein
VAADPTAKLLASAQRCNSKLVRSKAAYDAALREYRVALLDCWNAGVSYSELGRQFNTSAARIREQVLIAEVG